MKKLITIILALIMTLITAPQKGADQPPVNAVKPPQTAITTSVEQVPETSETTEVTAFVSEDEEPKIKMEIEETTATESKNKPAETEMLTEEKTPLAQETTVEESTEIAEIIITTEPKKKQSSALTTEIKALRNTNRRSAVSRIPSRTKHLRRLMIDRWRTTLAKVKTAPAKANTSKEKRRDCTKRAVPLFFVHSSFLEKSAKI